MSEGHPDLKHAADRLFESSVVRLGTVIAVIAFVIGATWQTATWFSAMSSGMTALQTQVNALSTRLDLRFSELEARAADRWRKGDMAAWCRETELKNQGWKCGAVLDR